VLRLLSLVSCLACAGALASSASARAPIPVAPHLLPGHVRVAAVDADSGTWLVGARRGLRANRIAARFKAHQLDSRLGIFSVDVSQARALARALGRAHILQFSEPNARLRNRAFPFDPLGGSQWGLTALGVQTLTPPAVGPQSALLGVLENGFDGSHPDVQGSG
jgi:hypothetical protein